MYLFDYGLKMINLKGVNQKHETREIRRRNSSRWVAPLRSDYTGKEQIAAEEMVREEIGFSARSLGVGEWIDTKMEGPTSVRLRSDWLLLILWIGYLFYQGHHDKVKLFYFIVWLYVSNYYTSIYDWVVSLSFCNSWKVVDCFMFTTLP